MAPVLSPLRFLSAFGHLPGLRCPNRKPAEYCFEGPVSEERELTEFLGKLGEFCEKLRELVFAHK